MGLPSWFYRLTVVKFSWLAVPSLVCRGRPYTSLRLRSLGDDETRVNRSCCDTRVYSCRPAHANFTTSLPMMQQHLHIATGISNSTSTRRMWELAAQFVKSHNAMESASSVKGSVMKWTMSNHQPGVSTRSHVLWLGSLIDSSMYFFCIHWYMHIPLARWPADFVY